MLCGRGLSQSTRSQSQQLKKAGIWHLKAILRMPTLNIILIGGRLIDMFCQTNLQESCWHLQATSPKSTGNKLTSAFYSISLDKVRVVINGEKETSVQKNSAKIVNARKLNLGQFQTYSVPKKLRGKLTLRDLVNSPGKILPTLL